MTYAQRKTALAKAEMILKHDLAKAVSSKKHRKNIQLQAADVKRQHNTIENKELIRGGISANKN